MATVLLGLLLILPLATALACAWLGPRQPERGLRLSLISALLLVLVVNVAVVDAEIALIAGRSLELSPIAQLGIQILGLAMLGFLLSLYRASAAWLETWLPVAWLSLLGLILSLLVTSLSIGLIIFLGAALLWAFGLPAQERIVSAGVIMRYAALISLAVPLLLIALEIAELRGSAQDSVERLVLALAVPAFGLILGLIPLHAWTLTLAGGTPRAMVFGVISLVQTTGFLLLLETLATYPWMAGVASETLVAAGAISACIGGWMALSARRDDPDDWLVYAAIANSGMLLAGLGTQSEKAGAGVALLLFARVLALVTLDLAPRVPELPRRLAYAAGTLALAGTPGLAGFPGMWLILQRLEGQSELAKLALLAGSGLLFATALRRWRADAEAQEEGWVAEPDPGARRMVMVMLALLVLLGIAPQIVAPAFDDALRDIFFSRP